MSSGSPHKRCWKSSFRFVVIAMLAIILLQGCAQHGVSPYQSPSGALRNSLKAQELTQQAADILTSEPQKAEKLLREALAADIFFGPAHNDLGVIALSRGELFEAANEFEWARKLMPGHPDPRMNLALTLEKAGRIDEALCTYGTALEVYPGHIPTMQAMAQLQIRHNRVNDQTKKFLQEVALSGDSEQWRTWAQQQFIRLSVGKSTS